MKPNCPDCGGYPMGPIYWKDEVPPSIKRLCRKGRVVFSGDELDGYYDCAGTRSKIGFDLTITAGPCDNSVIRPKNSKSEPHGH